MKRKAFSPIPVLAVFFLIIYCLTANAQTILIDPSGDGGFENGNTFSSNGWNVTSSAITTDNQWVCNSGATSGFSGTRCAYVSNNTAGTPPPHTYTTSATRVSHIYRDISIPANAINIYLNFNWIATGESTFDRLRIWLVPTSYTPLYGTEITANGSAPTGQVQQGLVNYSAQTSWTSAAQITIPAAYAGTTIRLVFEWKNDNSAGTNPPAAIDNISLTCTVPPTVVFVNATSGVTSASYPFLKNAIDKINDGTHRGNINITIGSADNQTITETAQSVLNKSGSGSASYSAVTISPAYSNITINASFAGACCEPTGIIKLNSAENVTIDGRIGLSGSTCNLALENTNTGSYASTVYLYGANNNIIRYCTLKSATTATLNGTGTLSFIASGSSGCNNNLVEYCNFSRSASGLPNNAIASSAASSSYKSQNNTIRYCSISDFQKAGIWLGNSGVSSYNDLWTINNNSFYQTSTITINSTNFYNYAIMIGYHDGGGSTFRSELGTFIITNNKIGGNGSGGDWAVTSTTSSSSLVVGGIFAYAGTAAYSDISNNLISNFNITTYVNSNTSISGFNGIYAYHCKVRIGSTGGNTISNITLDHKSTWGGVISGITLRNNVNYYCEISNNQVYNITAETGTSGYFQFFYGIYDWAESSVFSDIVNKNIITNINLNLNSHGYGIHASGAITQNHISKIKVSNGTADLIGIYFFGTPTADRPNYRVDNNEVILGLDNTGTSTATGRNIYGIVINGIGYAYYNSILLQGSHSGSTNTYCLKLSTSSGPGFNVANNLLYNTRTGGTGTHYCILTNSTNAITSSNNAYIFEGSNNKAGLWNNSTVCNTLPDWVALAAEVNSIDTTVSAKPLNVLFPNANSAFSNLFPTDDKWLCAGKVVTQMLDFVSSTRHASAPTTIGAYEKNCPLLLPVSLLRFEALETPDGEVLVQWTSGTETNNDFFILEKKIGDHGVFSILTTAKAAGNSNIMKNYSYVDELEKSDDPVYYRLLQVDYDGKTYDLGVTLLKRGQDTGLQCRVYPNPASGYVFINILSDIHANCQILVSDLSGRIVKELRFTGEEDFYGFGPIEMPAGYYTVSVKQESEVYNTTLVVY